MITYAYYPGCVAQESGKELDNATKFIAGKLGINLITMPERRYLSLKTRAERNRQIV